LYVKFNAGGENELVFDKINHYIPEKLLVYLGYDVSTDAYYSG